MVKAQIGNLEHPVRWCIRCSSNGEFQPVGVCGKSEIDFLVIATCIRGKPRLNRWREYVAKGQLACCVSKDFNSGRQVDFLGCFVKQNCLGCAEGSAVKAGEECR